MNKNENLAFTCSNDKFSKVISFLVFALTISMFLLSPTKLLNSENTNGLAGIISGTALSVLLLLTYGYSPRAYEIGGNNIIIKRPFGDKIIPSDEIKKIRKPAEKELNWPIRKFGNGGLFGYTGIFYTKHEGNMLWYCSRKSHYIIIERKSSRPVVISPDDPDGFIHAFGTEKS